MALSSSEPFTLVSSSIPPQSIAPSYEHASSHTRVDPDIQFQKALRESYPELCMTVCPSRNAPLLDFAAAGFASYELDTETESVFRWRGYYYSTRRGGEGALGDSMFFSKYHYKWSREDYIVYIIDSIQYILKEPDINRDEHVLSHNSATDALIKACAIQALGNETDYIYVYDGYWSRSRELYEEVQKSSWDKVILDPKMKKAVTNVTKNFFDSKEVYRKYGVPWRRGIIFYGPPGNGKTISVKALMKGLYNRKEAIPTLYVRSATYTYEIAEVFDFARSFSPCLLVMEDIETIVTPDTRSYFFNEVDGIENNDGIMMVATTNYVERLDPGISKRPSRFDRKYNFPLPGKSERTEYGQYWQKKLARDNPAIEFPDAICPALAKITQGFSFAYMQEAFIAALLMLAREDQGDDSEEESDAEVLPAAYSDYSEYDSNPRYKATKEKRKDDLDQNRLWIALKTNVEILREDLENHDDEGDDADDSDGDGNDGRKQKPAPNQPSVPSNSHPAKNSAVDSWAPYRAPPPMPLPVSHRREGIPTFLKSKPLAENKFAATSQQYAQTRQVAVPSDLSGNYINPGTKTWRYLPASIRGTSPQQDLGSPSDSNQFDPFQRMNKSGHRKPRQSMDDTPQRGYENEDEPSTADMASVGVGKYQDFTEAAFEFRPL